MPEIGERDELTITVTGGVLLDVLTAAKVGLKSLPASGRRRYEDSLNAVVDEAKSAAEGYPRHREVPLD